MAGMVCAHDDSSAVPGPGVLQFHSRSLHAVVFCSVCAGGVVTRLVTRRVRAHSCVRETCVRRLRVTVYEIILPFARGCRVGV